MPAGRLDGLLAGAVGRGLGVQVEVGVVVRMEADGAVFGGGGVGG